MAQIFHRSTNVLSKLSIFGSFFILAGVAAAGWEISQSPWTTGVDTPKDQPVPFSHEHHVSGLGIDCRYCHEGVETSAFAGVPPVKTCMTCHSQIWTNAAMLEPVRFVPRPRGPHAAHLAGEHSVHALVSRLPPESGDVPSSAGGSVQHGV